MLCIFLNSCVLAYGFAVLVQCRECTSPLQLCGMKAAFEVTKKLKNICPDAFPSLFYRFIP